MAKNALQHLFDHFKADLEKRHNIEGQFVCPLCLQSFTSTERLSKAHLWPEALGGRIYTLSCKICNNRIGTEIESHESKRVEYAQKEEIPFRMRTVDADGSTGGLLSVSKDKNGQDIFEFVISDKHSNPNTLKEHTYQMDTSVERGVGFNFNFDVKHNFNESIALLTYLHFAYMSLFHLAGYSWIAWPEAKAIRNQLERPEEALLHVLTFDLPQNFGEVAEPHQPILFEITDSKTKGFIVATPELHYNNYRIGVWISNIHNFTASIPDRRQLQVTLNFVSVIENKPRGATLSSRKPQ